MDQVERHAQAPVKAPAPQLTPEQIREIRRGVEAGVAHMMLTRVPISKEDALQEGWAAALDAARNWRPDGGANLMSWSYRAARVSARLLALKQGCAVSASKAILRRMKLADDEAFRPARPDQSPAARRLIEGAQVDLDAGAASDRDAAAAGERTAWLRRRRAYQRAVARLPVKERRIAEAVVARAWLGLPVRNAGAFAEAEGLGTRREAARALRLLREALLDEQGAWEAARTMIREEAP